VIDFQKDKMRLKVPVAKATDRARLPAATLV
jgi:RNA polymerase-interacting CarD/CdnL/TRCF family regulator